MPATLYNAPARPRLTGLVVLVLAMVILAVLSMAFVLDSPARQDSSASHRPAFTRRISTLPAIVVAPPETAAEPQVHKMAPR